MTTIMSTGTPRTRTPVSARTKVFYGYKAHEVEDADSEFIVRVKTTPPAMCTTASNCPP